MSSVRISNRERRGLDPSEHIEAKRFMAMVRMHEPRLPELKMLTHVPMGGWRNKVVAAKLKAEGAKAGYPDYLLDVPRGEFHGWRCELKTMTGRPSPEQKDWHDRLRSYGYKVDVCRGWDEAWAALKAYLALDPPG